MASGMSSNKNIDPASDDAQPQPLNYLVSKEPLININTLLQEKQKHKKYGGNNAPRNSMPAAHIHAASKNQLSNSVTYVRPVDIGK